MKEIIPLCFGQCGINIGSDFIQQIYREHFFPSKSSSIHDRNANYNENDELMMNTMRGEASIYFSESSNSTFTSRGLLIDLQSQFKYQSKLLNNDEIQNTIDLNNNVIFPRQNGVYCSPDWPGGKYESGADLFTNDVMDRVRKLLEDCDSFHGFQFFHGMVGSSSGFYSRICAHLREEYPDKMFWSCSVFHDSKSEDKAVWMYDSILTFQYMMELNDMITCVRNSELIDKCVQNGKDYPTYRDYNNVIRSFFPNITSVFRYPSQQGCDLRKMCLNLAPTRHCLIEVSETTALQNETTPIYETIYNLNSQLIQQKSSEKILSAISILRASGTLGLEAERNLRKSVKDHSQSEFPFKPLVVNQQSSDNTISNTLLTNSSSITTALENIYEVTERFFRRKTFIYGYTRGGLEEMEITESQYYLREAIDTYTESEPKEDELA
ncbi:beta-tubulin [Naegleria gruberi]|uniref:Beta-tubulin n=1 Tax=Naegleria gruberi TaxID=5762 RepID=D2VKR7_NAEGR|nr:LOW QUALITY PROTEIN: beta-tubulin [Naegleria gruberi]EFC42639.1 beta-tubulin [Naegleria gruberi]|eukprot:XP_002675383.1 beta-tubulin [Naegleria gruberi]